MYHAFVIFLHRRFVKNRAFHEVSDRKVSRDVDDSRIVFAHRGYLMSRIILNPYIYSRLRH